MIQLPHHRWRPSNVEKLLWVVGIAIALTIVCIVLGGYLFGWKWTAFPKQKLWDWLDLLIIPAVLALGGYLFTRSENQAARVVAEQRAQDEALQAYLDQMGQMLLDKDRPLRQSDEGDDVQTLARARTLTVLTSLDGERKRSVLRCLYESDVISRDTRVVNLNEADLRGAKLGVAIWTYIDLSGANLSGADLSATLLHGANLRSTDLENANLALARGITAEELEQQSISLAGATMPNGQKYEAWLKSRGEENTAARRNRSPQTPASQLS